MLNVFNELFLEEKDSIEFNKVMNWTFPHLFSDTGGNVYNISWIAMKSIVNENGAYRKILTEIDATATNHLHDDKSTRAYHEPSIYLMAHLKANGNFQTLMKEFQLILNDIKKSEYSYRKVFYKWNHDMGWDKHQ